MMMKEIEALYESHGQKIYNYFYYLTYDEHKAHDLTQETFYQAIISIVRYKGNSSMATWLFSIARNVFLKCLRKEKKRAASLDETILINSREKAFSGPEEEVLKQETIALVSRVIQSLPEHLATVLVLREKEELPYATIAQITGMSEAAVKVNLYRARQKFKEKYRDASES